MNPLFQMQIPMNSFPMQPIMPSLFPPNIHNPMDAGDQKPKNSPKNTLYISNLNERVKLDGTLIR